MGTAESDRDRFTRLMYESSGKITVRRTLPGAVMRWSLGLLLFVMKDNMFRRYLKKGQFLNEWRRQ
jgi:hypothetical protein